MTRVLLTARSLLTLSAFAAASGFGCAFAQKPLSAHALLKKYESALTRFDDVELSVAITDWFKGGPLREETVIQRSRCTCRLSGGRWKIKKDGQGLNVHNGRRYNYNINDEFCTLDGYCVAVEVEELPRLTARTRANASKWPHPAQRLGGAGVILGYLPGNGDYNLAALLRESLSKDSRTTAGRHGDVLDCHTRYGNFKIVFDAAADFIPREVNIARAGADIFGERPLSSYTASEGQKGGLFPLPPVRKVSFSMVVNSFKPLRRTYVPADVSIKEVRSYASGATIEWRTQVVVEQLKEIDGGASLFTLDTRVPNGTPVFMPDSRGISYEWVDGVIRKKTFTGVLGGAPETAINGFPWRIPLLGMAIASACGLIAVAWPYLASRKTK